MQDTLPASDVTDPVCGMSVDPHTTPHRHVHGVSVIANSLRLRSANL
jgi:hypothetical protein